MRRNQQDSLFEFFFFCQGFFLNNQIYSLFPSPVKRRQIWSFMISNFFLRLEKTKSRKTLVIIFCILVKEFRKYRCELKATCFVSIHLQIPTLFSSILPLIPVSKRDIFSVWWYYIIISVQKFLHLYNNSWLTLTNLCITRRPEKKYGTIWDLLLTICSQYYHLINKSTNKS